MIIEPKILRNVCLTAHPRGCAKGVEEQINWIQQHPVDRKTPQRVLVIGGSTGYGLAVRIAAAFWGKADTVAVSFERSPKGKKTATPGWYNNRVFDREARKEGLKSITIEGDAFSHETKEKTIQAIRDELGAVDLVVYSLASPMRIDPDTGERYNSVIKPIGKAFTGLTVDMMTEEVSTATVEPADEDAVEQTVKVMGGEDWKLWIDALNREGLLSSGALTTAFSYIGPELTYPIYREGTIGKAKEDLEQTADEITRELGSIGGNAFVSVNKALVTRASAVIPVVPLYISILYKVMKEKGIHEGCIEQMYRLLHDRLYVNGEIPTDESRRIRLDDFEMREDVQHEVKQLWDQASNDNIQSISDIQGFRTDYLKMHGFGFPLVDYGSDVDPQTID